MAEESENVHAAVGVARGFGTASAVSSVRRNLAIVHLTGAASFARQAGQLETAEGATLQNTFDQVRQMVISCVLMSAAAVEANFNELMADEETPDWFLELIERRSIIDRHNAYLQYKTKQPFDGGRQPAQGFMLLTTLRNALVHFKPDWDEVQEVHGKIAKRLEGVFPLSPFVPAGTAPIFPMRCMSHGCTEWAVKTAWNFVDDFATRLDKKPKFRRIADQLKTESTGTHTTTAIR
jgi:hypothetical protein